MSTAYLDVAEASPQHLTDQDRCDRCGLQAYVRVTLPTGELLFCAHDYQQLEARLRPIATAVLDERELLHTSSGPGVRRPLAVGVGAGAGAPVRAVMRLTRGSP